MGIPLFFRSIIKKNSGTYETDAPTTDNFYIDFNAMVYNVLNRALSDKDYITDLHLFEKNLIDKIQIFMKDIIFNIVCPQKLLYIAMDGTVPVSKMIKQRSRRYKAIIEQNYKKELEAKYSVKIIKTKWSTSSISPGTVFMSNLSKTIVQNIKNGYFSGHNKKLQIIFSSDMIPEEGEHKIMEHIRSLNLLEQKQNSLDDGSIDLNSYFKNSSSETTVIYSPDADLIVLCSMLSKKSMYIMRHSDDIEKGLSIPYVFLNIDAVNNAFFNEIYNDTSTGVTLQSNIKRYLLDYSFLTFLCGNDHVVHSSFLKIKDGGLELLISIYKMFKNHEEYDIFLINNDNTINLEYFIKIIKELARVSESFLQKSQQKRDRVRKGLLLKDQSRYEGLEKWEIELQSFQHEEYFSPVNPYFEKYNRIFDKINYYDKNWISQYNNFFFQNVKSSTLKTLQNNIDDVCHEYYKSLMYCLNTYVGTNKDFEFYYKYRVPPTFQDFYEYLVNLKQGPTFTENKPLRPFEQLSLIIPRDNVFLLPKCIHLCVPSQTYELDVVQGQKYIYTELIMSDIDLVAIKKNITDLEKEFTRNEKIRNINVKDPFYLL